MFSGVTSQRERSRSQTAERPRQAQPIHNGRGAQNLPQAFNPFLPPFPETEMPRLTPIGVEERDIMIARVVGAPGPHGEWETVTDRRDTMPSHWLEPSFESSARSLGHGFLAAKTPPPDAFDAAKHNLTKELNSLFKLICYSQMDKLHHHEGSGVSIADVQLIASGIPSLTQQIYQNIEIHPREPIIDKICALVSVHDRRHSDRLYNAIDTWNDALRLAHSGNTNGPHL